jgi:hypothetical protein
MAGQRAKRHTDRWARQLHAGLDSGFAKSFPSGQQFAGGALTWTGNREGPLHGRKARSTVEASKVLSCNARVIWRRPTA